MNVELADVALWKPFRRGPRTDAINPINPLSIPTLSVGERGLSVMGMWLKVADQHLLEADFTRVLSDCEYHFQSGQPCVPHAAVASTSTCCPNPSIRPIDALQSSAQTSVTLRSCQLKA